MRRIVVGFAAAVFATASFAEWVKIQERWNKSVDYVERSSIKKVGPHQYQFWMLNDFQKPKPHLDFLSMGTEVMIDCKQEIRRTLVVVAYEGPMGKGKPMHHETASGEPKPYGKGDSVKLVADQLCAT